MSKLNYCEWSLPDVTRKHDVDSLAYDELDAPHSHNGNVVAELWAQVLKDFNLTQDDIDEDWQVFEPVIENLLKNCHMTSAIRFFRLMIVNPDDFNDYAYDRYKDSLLED